MTRENSLPFTASVLVTGALGFIGRAVIGQLLQKGAGHIVALDRSESERPAHWDARVKYVAGDICQKADVERAMDGIAVVIHLAFLVGSSASLRQQRKVALQGSVNIFEAALAREARVTLASSIVVYGNRLTKGSLSEDSPWGGPMSPYSICKQEQERLAWKYYREKRMLLSVVRLANVYGPHSRPWVESPLRLLKRGLPILISGGNFNASLIHAEDAAQLLILASLGKGAVGEAFNGDGAQAITWKRYFSNLAELSGCKAPRSAPYALMALLAMITEALWRLLPCRGQPPYNCESWNLMKRGSHILTEKAEKELGYRPEISYQQGMEQIGSYLQSEAHRLRM